VLDESRDCVIDLKAALAELVAMMLFVLFGCGAACAYGADTAQTRLVVAFAFGMAIMVLAYSVVHLSGGHINGAVTFSLVLGGHLPWYQGLLHLVVQLVGSLLGACVLTMIFPCELDATQNLGANLVNPDYGVGRALVAEIVGTFLLCKVVWEVAVSSDSKAGPNACLAIGFAVFLAHLVLLPIDGCSINPTRSFGPAIVAKLRSCGNFAGGGLHDMWVMWVGPGIGAALAAVLKRAFQPRPQRQVLSEGPKLAEEDSTFDAASGEIEPTPSEREGGHMRLQV